MLFFSPWISNASSASISRSIAASRVSRVRDHLRDHRIVMRRHVAAFGVAGLDAHARTAAAAGTPSACPATERSSSDPPRTPAPGSRGRAPRSFGGRMSASLSPAAERICACTRSTPVTSSVTPCSTWSRVFISRKLNDAVRAHQHLHGADVVVAHLAHDAARCRPPSRVDCVARNRRAPALPRSPSGCAAASSSRARRDATALPCRSPSTWNSTWRGRSIRRSR